MTLLVPECMFENFRVGWNNQFAYMAALSFAESPGLWNPLYIYGPSRTGKTHLLHAIGNRMVSAGSVTWERSVT